MLRQPITAITNKVEYNPEFLKILNGILTKSVPSYTSIANIEKDYLALKSFVDPAPPPDATNKGIVIGSLYTCRALTLGARPMNIKVTDIDYATKEVITVPSASTDPAAATTKYPANRCTPLLGKAPQRGGQTTPAPFRTTSYKTGLRSLTTLLEQLQQIKSTSGLPAYDAVIKANQDRAAQQQALINNVRTRVEDLIAAETGRLRTGLTAIQDVITKYTTEKTSAEVPAKQFDDEIAKYTDLLNRARTRMGELEARAKEISSGQGSVYMGGGRRRGRGSRKASRSRRGRKGTRRSA
jgi:hypothetical protein